MATRFDYFPDQSTLGQYKSSTGTADTTGGGVYGATTDTSKYVSGAPPVTYSSEHGGIPRYTNLQTSQANALSANQANMSSLLNQGSNINAYNYGQQLAQYQASIPNYNAKISQLGSNIGSWLSGDLTQAEIDNMRNEAAARGISTGTIGSEADKTAYLARIGQTTTSRQQAGQSALSNLVSWMPKTSLYDVSQNLITPSQQAALQYTADTTAASPDPTASNTAKTQAAQTGQNAGYSAASRSGGTSGINTSTGLTSAYSGATGSVGSTGAAGTAGGTNGYSTVGSFRGGRTDTGENAQDAAFQDYLLTGDSDAYLAAGGNNAAYDLASTGGGTDYNYDYSYPDYSSDYGYNYDDYGY